MSLRFFSDQCVPAEINPALCFDGSVGQMHLNCDASSLQPLHPGAFALNLFPQDLTCR
jgi:hypothetical protein